MYFKRYYSLGKEVQEKYMRQLIHQYESVPKEPISWNKAKPFSKIPGPKPMPLLGNSWRFLPFIGNYYGLYAHEQHKRFHAEFGDIMKLSSISVMNDIVFVFNPNDVETVFRNDSPWPIRIGLESLKYYRLKTRNNIFQNCGGTATSHGEEWYNIRTTVSKPLMDTKSLEKYLPVINDVSDEFINKTNYLLEMSHNKNELPDQFTLEIFKWAFESIVAITLNSRLGVLKPDLNENSDGKKMIDAIIDLFPLMYKLDMLPSLWRLLPTRNWKKYVEKFDVITNICVDHINRAIEDIESNANRNQTPSLLETLIQKDRRIAIAMSVDLLLGGTETTSETVASCLFYMAKNKEAQTKLREEIFRLVPDKNTIIDKKILDQCHYLKAVLKESMRLAPVAIATLRAAGRDIVLSGYQVPKGTNIINCHIVLCHSEKYFPQAMRFIPERWIRTEKDNQFLHKNTSPFLSLPFGYGPRACIGRRLSEIEMEILLIKIIRNYELEWHNGEMQWQGTLVYGIKSPLKLHVKRLI